MLNNFVTLGRSGLRVSPLCLGTMTFGEDWGWGSSVKESCEIMDRYVALGGNFLDTANLYTKGHSEKIIGDHIGRNSSKRDRMVIATKFFGSMYSGDPNAGGANRKAIYDSLHHSLRRLQTDYIDLYWMHCWDRFTPIEETIQTLNDVVASGKVRYIGFSDTPAWKVTQAHVLAQLKSWTPLSAIQVEYSLLERSVEGELIPMALELGLGVTPWSPLKSGVLSGKFRKSNAGQIQSDRGAWAMNALTDNAYEVIELLYQIASEHSATPAQIALNWVQNKPGVTSTIIGARTLEQLEKNVSALSFKLRKEDIEKLDLLTKPSLNFPFDFVVNSGPFRSSGSNIHGENNPVNPLAPANDTERY